MKKSILVSLMLLTLIGGLIIAYGQTKKIKTKKSTAEKEKSVSSGFVPEISQYGNLVRLKDANDNNVFASSQRPLHEGYALAYQVDGDEPQFAYAVGGKERQKNLAADKSQNASEVIVNTADGKWQITQSAIWDERQGTLEIKRIAKNTYSQPTRMLQMETQADAKLAFGADAAKLRYLDPAYRVQIRSGVAAVPITTDFSGCDCDVCSPPRPGCSGLKDKSGWFKPAVTFWDAGAKDLVFSVSSAGVPLPSSGMTDSLIVILSWSKGVNLPEEPILPGREIVNITRYQVRVVN